MESGETTHREALLLTAMEQVGKTVDFMQSLLAQLEVELQSQRERQAAPVLKLVVNNPRD